MLGPDRRDDDINMKQLWSPQWSPCAFCADLSASCGPLDSLRRLRRIESLQNKKVAIQLQTAHFYRDAPGRRSLVCVLFAYDAQEMSEAACSAEKERFSSSLESAVRRACVTCEFAPCLVQRGRGFH